MENEKFRERFPTGPRIIMVTLWNRADHCIFILLFVLRLSFFLAFFLFFPCLISAIAEWMSAILAHVVWP